MIMLLWIAYLLRLIWIIRSGYRTTLVDDALFITLMLVTVACA